MSETDNREELPETSETVTPVTENVNPFAPESFPIWDWPYNFSSKWYLWNPATSSYIFNTQLAMKTSGLWIVYALLQWIILTTILWFVDSFKGYPPIDEAERMDGSSKGMERWWIIAKRIFEASLFIAFFSFFLYLQFVPGSDSWKVILWILISWIFFANAIQSESAFMWIFGAAVTAALPFLLKLKIEN